MATAAPKKQWDASDDDELRRLHAQGLPLNQLYKKMSKGWGRATVGRHAEALNLSFDRTPMVAAIEASQQDRKVRRAAVIDRLYFIVEKESERLAVVHEGKTYRTLVPVGAGEQRPKDLDFIPAGDLRSASNALSGLLGRIEALEKIDADGGMAEAKGLVGSILGALRAAAGQSGWERINPSTGVALR